MGTVEFSKAATNWLCCLNSLLGLRESCWWSGFSSEWVWNVSSCRFSSIKFIINGASSWRFRVLNKKPARSQWDPPSQGSCRLPYHSLRAGRRSSQLTKIPSGHWHRRAGVRGQCGVSQSGNLGMRGGWNCPPLVMVTSQKKKASFPLYTLLYFLFLLVS